MERVVVSVRLPPPAEARDLSLPAEVGVEALVALLVEACGLEAGEYALAAFPPGRVLGPGETLAEAGVWSGAWVLVERRD